LQESAANMPRKPADPVQLKLRFDEKLRLRIERAALRNNQSMNAEIIRRLEESFDREELSEFMRAAMWQALTQGGLAEALKPLAAQLVEKLDVIGFELTKKVAREIEARRESETKPEDKS
jgi:hypothetical protein